MQQKQDIKLLKLKNDILEKKCASSGYVSRNDDIFLDCPYVSFLTYTDIAKISTKLEKTYEAQKENDTGLLEAQKNLITHRMKFIESWIDKIPNYTLEEYAIRRAYAKFYLDINKNFKQSGLREVLVFDDYKLRSPEDAYKFVKTAHIMLYAVIIILFVISLIFFSTGLEYTYVSDIILPFSVISVTVFLMLLALFKLKRKIFF